MPSGQVPLDTGRAERSWSALDSRYVWLADNSLGLDVTGHPLEEAAGWQRLPSGEDWMTEADLEAWLDVLAAEDPPADPELRDPDPDDSAPPYDFDMAAIRAECRRIATEQVVAAEHIAQLGYTAVLAEAAASLGRRGPGQPGSAHRFPGEYGGPAGGFATGHLLDIAPGCSALLGSAERVAGDDDRFKGTDDELLGVISALDRAEANACSLKHAAVAELIRRRPAPGCEPQGPAAMPEGWDESAEAELAYALADYRGTMASLTSRAYDLEVKLPGTKAAFRCGILGEYKVEIICRATELLDPAEARAAEELVLGRAGRLTPAGLRAAITRAVIQVAPDKARKRREKAARRVRVERRPEYSGNAALMGRELPPAKVLAADQRINWWASQLKEAGVEGTMDELRAMAYLDLILDLDSRRRADTQANDVKDNDPQSNDAESGGRGGGSGASESPDPFGPRIPPGSGCIPAGFIGRNHLTVPLATLLELADRPGELVGLGPVDPALARDLARASAGHPKTTWCFTVTDREGHAIGHGCARLEPRNYRKRGHRQRARAPGPGFTFTPEARPGPPGGYGTWRFTTGVPGQPDLLIAIEPIAIDTCDHRREAKGHDPGVMLRHLTEIRHATCTGPTCRRPASRCDFEHNVPYEAGGRTCMCNGGPKCRHEHRLKQDPRWRVEQVTPGTFRWTTPSGRQYTTEPTQYPI
jgi:Domain of unknown function (DUF222)